MPIYRIRWEHRADEVRLCRPCNLVYKGFLFLLLLIGAANIFRYRVVPYLKVWVGEGKVFQQYYRWCCTVYDLSLIHI